MISPTISGISTLPLLPHFKNVLGVDPSKKMVETASTLDIASSKENLYLELSSDANPILATPSFKASSAESLSMIDSKSTDLVVAGQAIHWFNYSPFWTELDRILKPSGTVAFWVYAEIYFPKYPTTRSLVDAYCHGKEALGPHWSQPGRSILEKGLAEVPFPWEIHSDLEKTWDVNSASREMFSLKGLSKESYLKEWPQTHQETSSEEKEMSKSFSKSTLLEYFKTFSALHEYQKNNTADIELVKEGKGNDLASSFANTLWREMEKAEGKTLKEVEGKWPLALMICKKKAGNA